MRMCALLSRMYRQLISALSNCPHGTRYRPPYPIWAQRSSPRLVSPTNTCFASAVVCLHKCVRRLSASPFSRPPGSIKEKETGRARPTQKAMALGMMLIVDTLNAGHVTPAIDTTAKSAAASNASKGECNDMSPFIVHHMSAPLLLFNCLLDLLHEWRISRTFGDHEIVLDGG